MDCSHFRRQHLAYLDDTLCGDLMAAAQRHLLQCDACAAHDTRIRRALMVARNLPPVTPSPEFRARLDARLAACRETRSPARPLRPPVVGPLTAMAASAVLGALAWQLYRSARPPALAMQPVMASHTPVLAVPPQPLFPVPAAFSASPAPMLGEPFPAAGFLPVGATHATY